MRTLLPAFALILATLAPTSSHADDWGCEVLLCLSNPAGPKAVAECVAPIEKLWRQLRKGRPFPHCDLGSSSSGTGAVQSYNHYPPCPAGMTPLPEGVMIDTGSGLLRGFGDGAGMAPNLRDAVPLPQMACVAGYQGSAMVVADPDSDSRYKVEVSRYAEVTYLTPSSSGRVIDVYIDGKLFSRIPY